MRNSDSCAKKATVIGVEIGIRKERDVNGEAIQIPSGMSREGRDQKREIRIREGAMTIIVREEGIKRRSGGRGIAIHGRTRQIGGGTDIDTMKGETWIKIRKLLAGFIDGLYQMLINEL